MAKKKIHVRGFGSNGVNHDDDHEEPVADKTDVIDSAKEFFAANFSPAVDINDSTMQFNSLDILNKLCRQYGDVLLIEDLHAIMRGLGYKEVNLPGDGIRPVWLLKKKT